MDPLAMLANDRTRAREARDPWANLCVLATVDERSIPHARVIVLRDLNDRLAIFINATSPKHAQIELGTQQAVLIYLASVGVQYRLAVGLEAVPADIVHRNWRERPRIPKVMDWLYRRLRAQSRTVVSREALLDAYAALDEELPQSLEAPPDAVGYYLVVREIERLELSGIEVHRRQRFVHEAGAGWMTTEIVT